jgi:hypothetical protein
MQKIILFKSILAIFIMLFVVSTTSFAISEFSGAEIDIEILRGPHFPSPMMRITNIGIDSAHNVKITDVEVNGKILYNNRETIVADVLEPDSYKIADVNSWFFGFGLFNITISVSCDEGVFISDTVNGLIIGSLILIP